MPSQTAINNRKALEGIRRELNNGRLSYDQAADLAAPIIKKINEQAKAIAKKHGMRPQLVSFAGIMR